MNRYKLENINTGATLLVNAHCRKSAHEHGQHVWPGALVEVFTEAEFADRVVYRASYNQVMDLMDGIAESIYDSDYDRMIDLVGNTLTKLYGLEDYFRARRRAAGND